MGGPGGVFYRLQGRVFNIWVGVWGMEGVLRLGLVGAENLGHKYDTADGHNTCNIQCKGAILRNKS